VDQPRHAPRLQRLGHGMNAVDERHNLTTVAASRRLWRVLRKKLFARRRRRRQSRASIDGRYGQIELGTGLGAGDRDANRMKQRASLEPGGLRARVGGRTKRVTIERAATLDSRARTRSPRAARPVRRPTKRGRGLRAPIEDERRRARRSRRDDRPIRRPSATALRHKLSAAAVFSVTYPARTNDGSASPPTRAAGTDFKYCRLIHASFGTSNTAALWLTVRTSKRRRHLRRAARPLRPHLATSRADAR
jgi:hypothetical protein